MKIRKKVSVIILFLLIILVIGSCIIAGFQILGNVKSQEKESMIININRAKYIINNNLEELDTKCADWASWDDTLNFINTNDSGYIESNLNDNTFSSLKINAFIILDVNNKIRYANFYDIENKKSIDIPEELLKYIDINKELLFSNKDVHSSVTGVASIGERPLMLSARPITDSEFGAPRSGTIIMGKYLDDQLKSGINKVTDSNIVMKKVENFKIQKDKTNVNNGKLIFTNDNRIVIEPLDNNRVETYSIIEGVDGKPLFILELESKRTIYIQGLKSEGFMILLFIIFSTIILTLCMSLLKIFVIRPIEDISSEVSKINLVDSSISRISVKGKDEISNLGIEINNMLEKIEINNKMVSNSEKQLKLVLEGAGAGFWDWNLQKNTLYINEKFLSILGYSRGELPDNSSLWKMIIHKEDFDYCNNILLNELWNRLEINIIEQRMLAKCGEYKWILNQFKVVEYSEDGKAKRITGIVTDISDKKRYEEELKYLTYYDKLTGIFNRGYHEFILNRIDSSGRLPIAVIMGDLNGLKITNDTFGHEEGDKLLQTTAKILQKVCGTNAIVSRYGGDEFMVILENVNVEELEKICIRIKGEAEKKKVGAIYVNISLGYSFKSNKDKDINEVIKEAEEMMYRNKLLEDRSARNSIISSLRQTLEEKSNETEEHVERIYNLCTNISDILNLSTNEANELYLLAKLHDIGKIGIDNKILNKPGKLTEEEWIVMKTHSEIGYRIASSTPDLRHIAYEILTHHERYDGTGYPKGLKGEDIPLLSRIISIVDSFDVMTHDRPYKKAMAVEEAIKELRKCAGTQFDPNLVEICIQAFEKSS